MQDRLKINADLSAEANMLAASLSSQVEVSFSSNGGIRKNGPCPCGSGRKFKKCCLGEVNSGGLVPLKSDGPKKAIHTEYEPPKRLSKYVERDVPQIGE